MTRRKTPVKVDRRRQLSTLSFHTLQMMVMSGVVRRADLNPPPMPNRMGSLLPEHSHDTLSQESASERGWLSRIILGKKMQPPLAN